MSMYGYICMYNIHTDIKSTHVHLSCIFSQILLFLRIFYVSATWVICVHGANILFLFVSCLFTSFIVLFVMHFKKWSLGINLLFNHLWI